MKIKIEIVVNVPGTTGDQHRIFTEGVMEVFKRTFPGATPLPWDDEHGLVSPVTVNIYPDEPEVKHGN